MANSATGQHRIWGAIEVSSASSSSSHSVADDRPTYSAVQMKEHLKYLRERKQAGNDSWSPMDDPSSQVFQQRPPAVTAPLVFAEKRGKSLANSTNDSDCWDVDGELMGHMKKGKEWATLSSAASVDGQSSAPTQSLEGNMSNLPSAGSAAHAVGTCRPCHYVHTKVGCEKGANCGFCHYKHPKRRRPRPTRPDRAGRGEDEEGGYSSEEDKGSAAPGQEYAHAMPPAPGLAPHAQGAYAQAGMGQMQGGQPLQMAPPPYRGPPPGAGRALTQNQMLLSL